MYRHSLSTTATLLILACLGLVWAGTTLTGCARDEGDSAVVPYPPPETLVVITPHNAMIRELFRAGFSDWHQQKYGRYVDIQWITMGTVECLRYIQSVATDADATGRRRIPDLLFGGGIADHNVLVDKRLAKGIHIEDILKDIPESVLGLPTRHPEGCWHATALSGFGVLYHKKGCVERGIPEPATWSDLAKPEYYGWVAMADPTRSGSNRQCLTFVLQKYGWEEGWGIIMRMAANCRALLHRSSDVISDASVGVSLAGPTVNFVALQEIERQDPGKLAYVSPAGASLITPDLVTVLNVASNPELAERFVRFCLSEQGQVLWGVRREAHDTLFRYPVDPKTYDLYAGRLWATDNPLTMKSDWKFDLSAQEKQMKIVAPLLVAACGDNHIRLQTCWKQIIDSGLKPEALAELLAPPFDEETAYRLGVEYANGGPKAQTLAEEWSKAFQQKYDKVMSMLQS